MTLGNDHRSRICDTYQTNQHDRQQYNIMTNNKSIRGVSSVTKASAHLPPFPWHPAASSAHTTQTHSAQTCLCVWLELRLMSEKPCYHWLQLDNQKSGSCRVLMWYLWSGPPVCNAASWQHLFTLCFGRPSIRLPVLYAWLHAFLAHVSDLIFTHTGVYAACALCVCVSPSITSLSKSSHTPTSKYASIGSSSSNSPTAAGQLLCMQEERLEELWQPHEWLYNVSCKTDDNRLGVTGEWMR